MRFDIYHLMGDIQCGSCGRTVRDRSKVATYSETPFEPSRVVINGAVECMICALRRTGAEVVEVPSDPVTCEIEKAV